MLSSKLKVVSAVMVAGALTGCTTYSTAVNSLGPDRALSDLQDLDKEYVLASTAPLFCPAPEIYMVMPEDKGVGVVSALLNNGEQYVLEGDYAAISVSEAARELFTGDQEQLMELFGPAINQLTRAPIYHTVNFETDSTTLTAESQKIIKGIYQEILNDPVPEIILIGHTDTQASASYNMALSQQRADAIKTDLIAEGIDPEIIKIEARGETDLLVKTADNVAEVLNRRVVINVR